MPMGTGVINRVLCTALLGAAALGNISVRTPQPPSPQKTLIRPDTATVCILGDMMMHSGQIAEGGWRESLRLIRPMLEEATVSIANMEFTLGGRPYSGYPCFSAPEDYAFTAADCGIDVFLTANNHITDRGAAGLRRTHDIYGRMHDSLGIFTTGCDSLKGPLFIRANNIRVGIVNATYGTNSGTCGTPVNLLSDRQRLHRAIQASDSLADFTIVLPHWGEEYRLRHNPMQERTAMELAEAGADIIVGAHPHVVQDTAALFISDKEKTDGFATDSLSSENDIPLRHPRKVPVIYSLGNALSNMSATNTQLELMARLTLVRDPWGTRLVGTELIWLWCSRPGGFDSHYTVIPVEDYLDRRELWANPYDYDKMVSTYRRVRGIVSPEQDVVPSGQIFEKIRKTIVRQ